MKKILPALLCLFTIHARATTWNVNVDDFQFSPATLNVAVGDIVHFKWVSGTHTTTSVTVPAGAATFNSPINSTQLTFDYTVTQPGAYSYQCNFHFSLGMTASFTATGVVPVTLSSFNINAKNKNPQVSWTTQSELNADYFSIRRSVDGSSFTEIGRIPAAGNSSIEKRYSFIDNSLAGNITYVYYAVATIDKNGRTQLSPIKMYKNIFAAHRIIISLSPNPVEAMGHLSLQYNADRQSIMIAKLIDMQGKVIIVSRLSSETGVNRGHIHLMNVPAGMYVINFTLDGVSESYNIEKN